MQPGRTVAAPSAHHQAAARSPTGAVCRSQQLVLTDDGRQLRQDYAFLLDSVHEYKVGSGAQRPCLPTPLQPTGRHVHLLLTRQAGCRTC